MAVGLTALLTAASIPFAVGEAMEMGDRLGLDLTGERARAGRRLTAGVNSAGWAGLMQDTGSLGDTLGALNRQVGHLGPSTQMVQGVGGSDMDFIRQLFASEGMRLNEIGAAAKQMTFLDVAAREGLL